jgi:hypothetical protein
MREIMVLCLVLLVVGCGDTGPVTVTPELEAQQREQEKRVQEAETYRMKHPSTGDQEQENLQRDQDERVRVAEMEWQKQQMEQRAPKK